MTNLIFLQCNHLKPLVRRCAPKVMHLEQPYHLNQHHVPTEDDMKRRVRRVNSECKKVREWQE